MAEIPFEPYTGQSKLRFWCQKVLPLVYDDSLSYYELLGKVVEYLNNTITDVSACEDNITALRDAFVQLQNYVNEQLENFAPEVERIIDEMIDSGEFGEIVTDVVNGLIANEYSTTQGYAQFDYVLKDGKLYCAIVSTSGEWDATKWRETTVGADMQLLSQRLYNLNAGQVAFNESAEYVNNTVGKKLQELDSFGDNLNAGQIAFDESASYGNDTVGKKLKDLDTFDDNLNAGEVAYNSNETYNTGTVGKELQELNTTIDTKMPDDFITDLNELGLGVIIGKYNGATAHIPSDQAGTVWHFASSTNYSVQIALEMLNRGVWTRSKVAGTWTAWKQIALKDDVNDLVSSGTAITNTSVCTGTCKWVKVGNIIFISIEDLAITSQVSDNTTALFSGLPIASTPKVFLAQQYNTGASKRFRFNSQKITAWYDTLPESTNQYYALTVVI